MKYFIINIPFFIKIIIWKNRNSGIVNFYLYNSKKKFSLPLNLNKSSCFFDRWSNSIILDKKKINLKTIKINKYFNKILKSWEIYFFEKIKFKGKGFRIKFFKKIKLVKFYFGKSHKTFLFFKKIKIKKINKYKFILKSLNPSNLNSNSSKVLKIRKLNIYTLRGLRKSKQIVFKRKGKKGTYI